MSKTKLQFVSIEDYNKLQSIIRKCYKNLSQSDISDLVAVENRLMDSIYFLTNMYPNGLEVYDLPEA